ncbi:hypothetical protein AVEN_159463-1 [Araneus ventricosus]|uniref:Uncharacterized protein n=1 Tax=Araneus ventricosus TaxID=182803 RepID=A0A4Y2A3B7_ARAVE|nr:hypothetical protein AVEN_159463-1 [Araneus ventricosus]
MLPETSENKHPAPIARSVQAGGDTDWVQGLCSCYSFGALIIVKSPKGQRILETIYGKKRQKTNILPQLPEVPKLVVTQFGSRERIRGILWKHSLLWNAQWINGYLRTMSPNRYANCFSSVQWHVPEGQCDVSYSSKYA